MRFSSPIESETLEALGKANANGSGGFFPVGRNGFWHGGVHLETDKPIRCIADGRIVAYRINEKPLNFLEEEGKGPYSSSFVLVEHAYQSPKGNALKFFSLYMHLRPFSLYDRQKPEAAPDFYLEDVYTVIAKDHPPKGLNLRNITDGKVVVVAPKGSILTKEEPAEADLQNTQFAKARLAKAQYQKVSYTDILGKEHHGCYTLLEVSRAVPVVGLENAYKVVTAEDGPSQDQILHGSGLTLWHAMTPKDKTNIQGVVPKGTKIKFSLVNKDWALLTQMGDTTMRGPAYFQRRNSTLKSKAFTKLTFDAVVGANIPVKAGDLMGYPGMFEVKDGAPAKPVFHLEVFSGDDVPAFMADPKKETNPESKSFLEIPRGTAFYKKEPLPPDQKPKPEAGAAWEKGLEVSLTAGIPTTYKYAFVKTVSAVRTVDKSLLGAYNTAGKNYAVPAAGTPKLAQLSALFADVGLVATDKLILLRQLPGDSRVVKLTLPEERRVERWIPKPNGGKAKGAYVLESAVTEIYLKNPDAEAFSAQASESAEENLIRNLDACTQAMDLEGAHWLGIQPKSGTTAWVKQGDTRLKSAFEWPGFTVEKEEGDGSKDGYCDFQALSPFFQRVFKKMDPDGNGISDPEEMSKAIKDPDIYSSLEHMICLHPSEWEGDAELSKWKRLETLVPVQEERERIRKQVKNLLWWGDAAGKVKDFPAKSTVYHFHPLAFTRHMEAYRRESLRLSVSQVKAVMPRATEENIRKYLDLMNEELNAWGVDSRLKQAHILSQMAVESANWSATTEGVFQNSSASESYFMYMDPGGDAQAQNIANNLGNTEAGDGYRFRGRGLIQLTGRSNHVGYADYRRRVHGETYEVVNGQPSNAFMETLAGRIASEPALAVESAVWYLLQWRTYPFTIGGQKMHLKAMEAVERTATVRAISLLVNGGTNGLEERREFFKHAFNTFGLSGNLADYLTDRKFIND